MIPFARKNLFRDPAQFLVTLLGVGLSNMLILVVFGLYFGSVHQAGTLVTQTGGDIWVTQSGQVDLVHSPSILPSGKANELATLEGIESASPLILLLTFVEHNGQKARGTLLGFDPTSGVGNPWNVIGGKAGLQTGEVILDESVTRELGVGIGDSIDILQHPFRISGISRYTTTISSAMVFIRITDLQTILPQDYTNYYALTLSNEGSVNLEQLATEVQTILPSAELHLISELANETAGEALSTIKPILYVITGIGLLIGLAVIAMMMYAAVILNQHEFATLKALGSPRRLFIRTVTGQALLTGIGGFGLGIMLYYNARLVVYYLLPKVTMLLPWNAVILLGLLSLTMSQIAAIIPLRHILKLDPLTVFRR